MSTVANNGFKISVLGKTKKKRKRKSSSNQLLAVSSVFNAFFVLKTNKKPHKIVMPVKVCTISDFGNLKESHPLPLYLPCNRY